MLQGISLRHSAIAYVYRENPALKRQENLQFYDRVTASGVEVGDFSIQGPALVLLRRPAPGVDGLEVRVGSFGSGPQLRLLVTQPVATDPVELTRETADLVWEAFLAIWGERLTQPALTEVTLRFAAPAPGGSSVDFLRDKVAQLSSVAVQKLGRDYEGFGLRLMSSPAIHFGKGKGPALAEAGVQLRVETLLEDVSMVFLEAQVKWPAMSLPERQLPTEVRAAFEGPLLEVNPEARVPNYYLSLVYDYVTENLTNFLTSATK
jgi:hypothetical protein